MTRTVTGKSLHREDGRALVTLAGLRAGHASQKEGQRSEDEVQPPNGQLQESTAACAKALRLVPWEV